MTMVLMLRNFDHTITGATDRPSSSETRLASTFCAVSESESSTRHSRKRLPNIRKPTSATLLGAAMPAMKVTKMGKRMRVVREMLAGLYSIFIRRSFFGGDQADAGRLHDGHQRHVGIGRHDDGADVLRLKVLRHEDGGRAVGRADDGDGGRVLQREAQQARKGQGEEDANCAAAPQRIIFGLESSGPKSIIAPMPMKSNSGKSSVTMPAS